MKQKRKVFVLYDETLSTNAVLGVFNKLEDAMEEHRKIGLDEFKGYNGRLPNNEDELHDFTRNYLFINSAELEDVAPIANLRDEFAKTAMQGIISCNLHVISEPSISDMDLTKGELIARYAYGYADAMLAEREKANDQAN